MAGNDDVMEAPGPVASGSARVPEPVGVPNSLNLSAQPKGISYNGVIYRMEDSTRVETTFDIHAGNIASDHRYSGVGEGAVYGATSPETAFAEVDYYGVSANRISVSKNVSLSNVLDLTDTSVHEQLNFSLDQITGNSYSITQQLGSFARNNDYDGTLAPSARNPGGTNLVIFPKVKQ